jgi:hypothetical protein
MGSTIRALHCARTAHLVSGYRNLGSAAGAAACRWRAAWAWGLPTSMGFAKLSVPCPMAGQRDPGMNLDSL